jgi:hypothetical protein
MSGAEAPLARNFSGLFCPDEAVVNARGVCVQTDDDVATRADPGWVGQGRPGNIHGRIDAVSQQESMNDAGGIPVEEMLV